MIAEAVLHDVPRADARRMQEPAHAPPVMADAAGLVDGTGALEHMGEVAHRQTAERRRLGLSRHEVGFPQHGQARKVVQRRHRRHPVRGQLRVQVHQLLRRALISAARFQCVVVLVVSVQHQLSHRFRRR